LLWFKVQSICDSCYRFIYFGLAAPGSANYRDAIKWSEANELINDLPTGYIVIGDAAYKASEHLVPMFYGINRKKH
jgi:hypothetical protein